MHDPSLGPVGSVSHVAVLQRTQTNNTCVPLTYRAWRSGETGRHGSALRFQARPRVLGHWSPTRILRVLVVPARYYREATWACGARIERWWPVFSLYSQQQPDSAVVTLHRLSVFPRSIVPRRAAKVISPVTQPRPLFQPHGITSILGCVSASAGVVPTPGRDD